VERHEQPRGHRGAAGEERLAGDTGDRVASGPAEPGAHRRIRRPLTAASAAKVSINRDTVGSRRPAEHARFAPKQVHIGQAVPTQHEHDPQIQQDLA
jgi:hypothetical protein